MLPTFKMKKSLKNKKVNENQMENKDLSSRIKTKESMLIRTRSLAKPVLTLEDAILNFMQISH